MYIPYCEYLKFGGGRKRSSFSQRKEKMYYLTLQLIVMTRLIGVQIFWPGSVARIFRCSLGVSHILLIASLAHNRGLGVRFSQRRS